MTTNPRSHPKSCRWPLFFLTILLCCTMGTLSVWSAPFSPAPVLPEDENVEALLKRNELYRDLVAEAQADAGFFRYQKAIEKYKKAIALFPEGSNLTKSARLELTLLYYNSEQYEEAIPRLRIRITEHPKDKKLQRALGISLTMMDQTDEAEIILLDLLKSSPDDWEALAAMGGVHAQRKKYNNALQSYRSAAEKAEKQTELFYPDLYISIAWCHEQLEQWEEAIKEYKKIRRKKPKRWMLCYKMGHCYQQLGDDKNHKKMWKKFYDNSDVLVEHHREVATFFELEPREN